MLRVLLILGIILYFDLFFCVLFKKEFGKVLPFVYVLLAAIMHITSAFGKLSNFRYFLFAFTIMSFIYLLIEYKDKKFKLKDLFIKFFRPSTIVYIVIFVYLYIVLGNVEVNLVDDFHMWARKIKDMYDTDYLYYNNTSSDLGVIRQQPLPFLIQYAFIKLFGGGFNQAYSFLAMSTFSLSFFIPLFDKYEFKLRDLGKILFTLFIVICISLMIQTNNSLSEEKYYSFIYNSLYRDWLIAIVFAYGMFRVFNFKNEKFSYIELGMCNIVLIMSKEIAPVFAILLTFTLYIKLALDNRKILIRKVELIKILIYLIAIPCVYYLLWQVQLSTFSNLADVNISVVPTSGADNSFFSGYRLEVINLFIHNYFHEPIMTRPFNISYFFLSLLFALILLLLGHLKGNIKKNSYLSIIFFLGSIGYALAMLLSYLTVFGIYEALGLAMYGRYMQSYTYFGLVLIFYILLDLFDDYKCILGLCIIGVVLVEPKSIDTIIYKKDREVYRKEDRQYLEEYFNNMYDGWNKIVCINQTDVLYAGLIRYEAGIYNEHIVYEQLIDGSSVNDLKNVIGDSQYLLVGDYDDTFYHLFKELFDVEPFNNTIYNIYYDEDNNYKCSITYSWDRGVIIKP